MAAPTVVLEVLAPAAATLTPVYTVPAGRRARVRVRAFNNSGGAEIGYLNIYPAGSTSQTVWYKSIATLTAEQVLSNPLYMNEGDKLEGFGAAGNIRFTVTGMEEDIPRG